MSNYRILAGVCALSVALVVGCDKNPTAPSQTGDPGDVINPIPFLVSVDVLVFPGEPSFYPMYKFTRAGPDPGCDEDHWHSSEAVHAFGYVRGNGELVVWDLRDPEDGVIPQTWEDPNPTGCGYGKVSGVSQVRLLLVPVDLLNAKYALFGGPDD